MLQMDTQFYAHFTWISRNKISNIQNINKKNRKNGTTWINHICERSEDRRWLEHENISHNPTRRGVSTPKTSPTRGREGIQNSVSWELMEKRKDHEGSKDNGRKLPRKAYFPPPHWMPYNNLISCINRKATPE